MRIHFLYGTETGTAEMLAEDMAAAVDGHETSVADMDESDPTGLDKDAFHVLVCSTFGTGELPSTAEAFFDKLQSAKPDLSGLSFAVFGLGDRTFGETFNQGSESLMKEMQACKASLVGERGIYDASGADMPEDVAVPWLQDILEKAKAAA
ncbi:MAG: flavodoxin domain-containing protein [Pseudomonadota bacterium]